MSWKIPRPSTSKCSGHGANIAARSTEIGSRKNAAHQNQSLRDFPNRRGAQTYERLRPARQYSRSAKRTYCDVSIEKRGDRGDSNRYRDRSSTSDRRYRRDTNYLRRRNGPTHSSINRDRILRRDRYIRYEGNDSSFESRIQRRPGLEREGNRRHCDSSNDQSSIRLSHAEGERRNSFISRNGRPSEGANQNPQREINDVHGSDDSRNENEEALEVQRDDDTLAIADVQPAPRYGPGPYFERGPLQVRLPLPAPRHLPVCWRQTYPPYGYFRRIRFPYRIVSAGHPLIPRIPQLRPFIPTFY